MDSEALSGSQEVQHAPPSAGGGALGKIFLNDSGLRAGWRLLIYAALVAVLATGSMMVLRLFLQPVRGAFSPSLLIIQESLLFAVIFGSALIMSRIEKRDAGAYGLPVSQAFGRFFWQGWLVGLCEVTALMGLIATFGGYKFGSVVLQGGELVRWALVWGFFFLVVGFFEEFLFRGYTQFTLADLGFWSAGILFSVVFWRLHLSDREDGIGFWLAAIWLSLIFARILSGSQRENSKGIGFWPAAILLSMLFGRVHLENPGEGWVGAASVVMIGLILAFALRRTGNLWFVIGLHASFDFGETFLYSVPNSGIVFDGHLSNATLQGAKWLTGGSVGPEGSVFSFLTMAMLAVVIHILYPAKDTKSQQS